MVGEVFNEEDEENDSEEDMVLKKRQESIAIMVDNEETTPKDKLNTSDISGGMIKLGNGSDKSDNLNDSNELNASQISGGDINNISQINDEAETENMSSNMLSASLEAEDEKVEHLHEEGVLVESN